LKIDRQDPDEVAFTMTTVSLPIGSIGGQAPIFLSPNLNPTSITDPRRIAQRNYIQSYMNSFITNLTGANWTNPVTGYQQFVDVDSWVDNLIMNLICFNVDGYRLSGYFFKDRTKSSSKALRGIAIDAWAPAARETRRRLTTGLSTRAFGALTHGCRNDQGTDFFGRSSVGVNWFNRLFRDPDFWQAFIDRYQQFRTNEFTTSKVLTMVDDTYNEIKEAQVREQARWAPPPVGRQAFNWPRAGQQSVTTSAGALNSTYAFDFGPPTPPPPPRRSAISPTKFGSRNNGWPIALSSWTRTS